MDTIPKHLRRLSETQPDRELFVFYNGKYRKSYTSRQVFQLAGNFAGRLRRKYGCRKGDIIANTLPNSPERLFTSLGVILSGCVTVSNEVMFADGSDIFQWAHSSGSSVIIVSNDENSPAWKILEPYVTGDPSTGMMSLNCDKVPAIKSVILISRHQKGNKRPFLEGLQDRKETIFLDPDIRPDDMCIIYFTSGSTGRSKLVPKTHTEVLEPALDLVVGIIRQSRHDWEHIVQYNHYPLGWINSFPSNTIVNGDLRVLLDVYDSQSDKNWADIWSIICQENVNFLYLIYNEVPLLLEYLSKQGQPVQKIKLIRTSGQPIKKVHRERMFVLAEELTITYGSTENTPVTVAALTCDGDQYGDYFCGQPLPGLELKIVDQHGRECEAGQVGIIHVRGKNVFRDYLNWEHNPDPGTMVAVVKDGWFNTDDAGYLDEDKNVYVLGRQTDAIIFGGNQVYPGFLEPLINKHPDVFEACVVPVSDPVIHQNICAVVKPKTGSDLNEDKMRTFCDHLFLENRQVTWSPVPKFFLILDELPKTARGKIDRPRLKRLAEGMFGSK